MQIDNANLVLLFNVENTTHTNTEVCAKHPFVSFGGRSLTPGILWDIFFYGGQPIFIPHGKNLKHRPFHRRIAAFLLVLLIPGYMFIAGCATPAGIQSEAAAAPHASVPPAAAEDLQAARTAYARGDFENAANLTQSALRLAPDHAPAHLLSARIFDARDQFPEARAAVERCLELNPDSAAGWRLLGYLHLNRGRWEASAAASQRAIDIDSTNVGGQINLGYALYRLGSPDRAYYHYQKALALAPRNKQALIYSGLLLTDMRRIDEARRRFADAARYHPNDAEAHFRLGALIATEVLPPDTDADRAKSDQTNRSPEWKARYREARYHLEQSALLQSEQSEAYRVLTFLHLRAGEFERAIITGRVALAMNSQDIATRFNLGLAFYRTAEYATAKKLFAQVLEVYPDTSDARIFLGNACMRLGELDAAIKHFELLLERNPAHPEAHINLWRIYQTPGHRDPVAAEKHRAAACDAGVTSACD